MNKVKLKTYLIERKIIKAHEEAKITLLSGGYINNVFSVQTKNSKFIVKVYQEQASSGFQLGASKERAIYEIRALREMKKRGITCLPDVLFFDKTNYIAVLSHAPSDTENYNT